MNAHGITDDIGGFLAVLYVLAPLKERFERLDDNVV
jgi:hypothetical protein